MVLELGGHRPEGVLRLSRGGWSAEVGEEHDSGALAAEPADRRHRLGNAGGIRDLSVLERHVEVHPYERSLPFQRLALQGCEGALHNARAMWSIRSTQRMEYPISLSYHDETCTSVPSTTLVLKASTVLEWRSPL